MPSDPAARAGTVLEIDLGAIVANWRLLAAKAAPAACAAVVKANGYGLGAVRVAQALLAAGCRRFFVATLDEGMALRDALGAAPEIAVFNGPLPGSAARIRRGGADPRCSTTPARSRPGQVCATKAPAHHPCRHRAQSGSACRRASSNVPRIASQRSTPAGLISHLACADTPGTFPQRGAARAASSPRGIACRASRPALRPRPASFSARDYHFDAGPPGRRALWRQPDARRTQSNAAGRAAGGENRPDPQN